MDKEKLDKRQNIIKLVGYIGNWKNFKCKNKIG